MTQEKRKPLATSGFDGLGNYTTSTANSESWVLQDVVIHLPP